jgi:hypothetical protein
MTHCPYVNDFIRNGLPEYYGRSDVLYQTDYGRPIDRLPFFQTTPNRNTPEYNERMKQFTREAKQYWKQQETDRAEAARIQAASATDLMTAIEEIERWQTK